MGGRSLHARRHTFVPLEQRTALASGEKATCSFHSRNSSRTAHRRIETFYLNFTDSKEALDVLARERQLEKSIFELQDTSRRLPCMKGGESKEFAQRVQAALVCVLGATFRGK